ncbi:MAG: protein kinase [Eubacteriaceae bacterium]|nr:protein kinase [Eubacteriaceae bacterium]
MADRILRYEPLWGEWNVGSLVAEDTFGKIYNLSRPKPDGAEEIATVKIIHIPFSAQDFIEASRRLGGPEEAKEFYKSAIDACLEDLAELTRPRPAGNLVNFLEVSCYEDESEAGWDILIRMDALQPLNDRLEAGKFTKRDAVKLGQDISSALVQLEDLGIIHGDVKASNIFVSQTGKKFMLAFSGIASNLYRIFPSYTERQSLDYLSPEVYEGSFSAARKQSDTYSLGILLYRLTNNNRLPFLPDIESLITRDDVIEASMTRLSGKDVPIGLYAGPNRNLPNIIKKACSFDIADRYQTGGELNGDLTKAFLFEPDLDNMVVLNGLDAYKHTYPNRLDDDYISEIFSAKDEELISSLEKDNFIERVHDSIDDFSIEGTVLEDPLLSESPQPLGGLGEESPMAINTEAASQDSQTQESVQDEGEEAFSSEAFEKNAVDEDIESSQQERGFILLSSEFEESAYAEEEDQEEYSATDMFGQPQTNSVEPIAETYEEDIYSGAGIGHEPVGEGIAPEDPSGDYDDEIQEVEAEEILESYDDSGSQGDGWVQNPQTQLQVSQGNYVSFPHALPMVFSGKYLMEFVYIPQTNILQAPKTTTASPRNKKTLISAARSSEELLLIGSKFMMQKDIFENTASLKAIKRSAMMATSTIPPQPVKHPVPAAIPDGMYGPMNAGSAGPGALEPLDQVVEENFLESITKLGGDNDYEFDVLLDNVDLENEEPGDELFDFDDLTGFVPESPKLSNGLGINDLEDKDVDFDTEVGEEETLEQALEDIDEIKEEIGGFALDLEAQGEEESFGLGINLDFEPEQSNQAIDEEFEIENSYSEAFGDQIQYGQPLEGNEQTTETTQSPLEFSLDADSDFSPADASSQDGFALGELASQSMPSDGIDDGEDVFDTLQSLDALDGSVFLGNGQLIDDDPETFDDEELFGDGQIGLDDGEIESGAGINEGSFGAESPDPDLDSLQFGEEPQEEVGGEATNEIEDEASAFEETLEETIELDIEALELEQVEFDAAEEQLEPVEFVIDDSNEAFEFKIDEELADPFGFEPDGSAPEQHGLEMSADPEPFGLAIEEDQQEQHGIDEGEEQLESVEYEIDEAPIGLVSIGFDNAQPELENESLEGFYTSQEPGIDELAEAQPSGEADLGGDEPLQEPSQAEDEAASGQTGFENTGGGEPVGGTQIEKTDTGSIHFGSDFDVELAEPDGYGVGEIADEELLSNTIPGPLFEIEEALDEEDIDLFGEEPETEYPLRETENSTDTTGSGYPSSPIEETPPIEGQDGISAGQDTDSPVLLYEEEDISLLEKTDEQDQDIDIQGEPFKFGAHEQRVFGLGDVNSRPENTQISARETLAAGSNEPQNGPASSIFRQETLPIRSNDSIRMRDPIGASEAGKDITTGLPATGEDDIDSSPRRFKRKNQPAIDEDEAMPAVEVPEAELPIKRQIKQPSRPALETGNIPSHTASEPSGRQQTGNLETASRYATRPLNEPEMISSVVLGKKRTKLFLLVIIAALLAGAALYYFLVYSKRSVAYNQGVELFNSGEYQAAIATFEVLDGFKDSGKYIIDSNTQIAVIYNTAMSNYEAGDYAKAKTGFEKVRHHKDSSAMAEVCAAQLGYIEAIEIFESQDYYNAYLMFSSLGGIGDSSSYMSQCIQDTPPTDVTYLESVRSYPTGFKFINNVNDYDIFLKIYSPGGSLLATCFVRKSSSLNVYIEAGELDIRAGYGEDWFGVDGAFGESGTYFAIKGDTGPYLEASKNRRIDVSITGQMPNSSQINYRLF